VTTSSHGWPEAGRAVIAPTGEQMEIAAGDQQAVRLVLVDQAGATGLPA
jgi:hypothetical protein